MRELIVFQLADIIKIYLLLQSKKYHVCELNENVPIMKRDIRAMSYKERQRHHLLKMILEGTTTLQ